MFGGDFAPKDWAYCTGQKLNKNQFSGLFRLIGYKYGGSGDVFLLPNLQGVVPIGSGAGPGLTNRELGKYIGAEGTKLEVANLPTHTHKVNVVKAVGTLPSPTDNWIAGKGRLDTDFSTANPNAAMHNYTIGNTGDGLPVSNMQPYLAMNYIIALEGVFPDRS